MNNNEKKLLNFALTPNDFITAVFDASTIQLRVILLTIAKAKQNKSPSFSFNVNEYLNLMGLNTRHGHNRINLYSNIKKLSQLQIGIRKSVNQYAFVNWFDYIAVDNDIINVKFTQTIYSYIDLLKAYTSIDFRTASKISALATRYFLILKESKSPTLYSRLKRKTWTIQLAIDDIKDMFAIDKESYKDRNNNFVERIVRNPIAELNKYNLEFETTVKTVRTGRRISHILFTCKERYATKKILKTDTPEQKQEKQEINEQNKQLVEMELTTPELYQQVYEQENAKLVQNPFFNAMTAETKDTLVKANVYKELKEKKTQQKSKDELDQLQFLF